MSDSGRQTRTGFTSVSRAVTVLASSEKSSPAQEHAPAQYGKRSTNPGRRSLRSLALGYNMPRFQRSGGYESASSLCGRRVVSATGSRAKRGSGLFAIIALMALVGITGASLVFTATREYAQGARVRDALALTNLSEGGLQRAKAQIRRSGAYRGESGLALGPGAVSIRVETAGRGYRIEISAAVPNLEKPRRQIEVVERWDAR
jgi:hypothetical protein